MKPLRPQLRGLIFKLTVFYVLLSLPCLVLVETGLLTFEFDRFMAGVESGALTRATQTAAADLAQRWPDTDAPANLALWTDALVLRMQRPHGGLLAQDSFILTELSSAPLAAAVLDAHGRELAGAPTQAPWQPPLPEPDSAAWKTAAAQAGTLVRMADSPPTWMTRGSRMKKPITDRSSMTWKTCSSLVVSRPATDMARNEAIDPAIQNVALRVDCMPVMGRYVPSMPAFGNRSTGDKTGPAASSA